MPDAATALGGWLFRNRGWLPVPLVLAAVAIGPRAWGPGLGLVALGEAVRLWAVGHIGRVSRTRGAEVGRLVTDGPYARVRNPLYLGNQLLFAGLGVLAWPLVLVGAPLLGVYYALIVRWEESRVRETHGAAWEAWAARVPRWLPLGPGGEGGRWSAREALRSERGTLLAIGVVLGAMALRG